MLYILQIWKWMTNVTSGKWSRNEAFLVPSSLVAGLFLGRMFRFSLT